MPGAELGGDLGAAQKLADLAAVLVMAGQDVEHVIVLLSAAGARLRGESPPLVCKMPPQAGRPELKPRPGNDVSNGNPGR